MTMTRKICRIILTKNVFKGVIVMLLILMLIAIALDFPHEIVAGLLVIFLTQDFA